MAMYQRPVVNQGLLSQLGASLSSEGAEMPSLSQMLGLGRSLYQEEEQELESPKFAGADKTPHRGDYVSAADRAEVQRGAARSLGKFPQAELIKNSLSLRNSTEGNMLKLYNDVGGPAIGQGLNLQVQNPESLKVLVGGDENLYKKLSPLLGKKWDALSEDERSISLTPQEARSLNSSMVQASLDATAQFTPNMSNKGHEVLADLQHWAGSAGLRSARSSKLAVVKDGVRYNPIANTIVGNAATDEDLLAALEELKASTNKDFVRARVQKEIDYLKN